MDDRSLAQSRTGLYPVAGECARGSKNVRPTGSAGVGCFDLDIPMDV